MEGTETKLWWKKELLETIQDVMIVQRVTRAAQQLQKMTLVILINGTDDIILHMYLKKPLSL